MKLDFNQIPVENKEAKQDNLTVWYENINPKLTVPVMRYGNQTLMDEREMVEYLADKNKDKELIPFDESRKFKVNLYMDRFYAN